MSIAVVCWFRWTPSKQGFACSVKPPPRQDFAIFMRFLVVGAKDALAEKEVAHKEKMKSLGGMSTSVTYGQECNKSRQLLVMIVCILDCLRSK